VSFTEKKTPKNTTHQFGGHFSFGELGLYLLAAQSTRGQMMKDKGLPVNSHWRQILHIFQRDKFENRYTEEFKRPKI
jgi:hypothetical protein